MVVQSPHNILLRYTRLTGQFCVRRIRQLPTRSIHTSTRGLDWFSCYIGNRLISYGSVTQVRSSRIWQFYTLCYLHNPGCTISLWRWVSISMPKLWQVGQRQCWFYTYCSLWALTQCSSASVETYISYNLHTCTMSVWQLAQYTELCISHANCAIHV